jgi:hypothetical protein
MPDIPHRYGDLIKSKIVKALIEMRDFLEGTEKLSDILDKFSGQGMREPSRQSIWSGK